jgi:hypothetical protein
VGFFVDNVPVAENWMLGMCDVADCINDIRDPETIRILEITDTVESIKCFSNFRFSILIVIYNFILKYVDFLFDSIEHQKLDIFKERPTCPVFILPYPANDVSKTVTILLSHIIQYKSMYRSTG